MKNQNRKRKNKNRYLYRYTIKDKTRKKTISVFKYNNEIGKKLNSYLSLTTNKCNSSILNLNKSE